jgi:hypothetical protein
LIDEVLAQPSDFAAFAFDLAGLAGLAVLDGTPIQLRTADFFRCFL